MIFVSGSMFFFPWCFHVKSRARCSCRVLFCDDFVPKLGNDFHVCKREIFLWHFRAKSQETIFVSVNKYFFHIFFVPKVEHKDRARNYILFSWHCRVFVNVLKFMGHFITMSRIHEICSNNKLKLFFFWFFGKGI